MLESIASKINPQIFIVIGTLITMFGAYLAVIKAEVGSQKTNSSIEENKTLAKRNIELTTKNNTLGQANENLLRENLEYAKLQKELSEINIQLTHEVKEKSNEIDEYNKGTGGYCTMHILQDGGELGGILFEPKGKNPLKDLSVRIFDLNTYETTKDFNASNTNISIGNLYPGQSMATTYKVKMSKEKGIRLNLFYSSNNGFFMESVRMFYVNNNWERENVVYKDMSQEGKPLLLERSAKYPLEKISFK